MSFIFTFQKYSFLDGYRYQVLFSRPWPVFRANMRSSRNLMFVRERRRRWNSAHGSIFGALVGMPRTLPQIRNRPYEFSQQSPTRHRMKKCIETNLDWDDILEFWALNQHFGERMDHGSRPISAYDQLLKGRQGRPGPRGPHSSNLFFLISLDSWDFE